MVKSLIFKGSTRIFRPVEVDQLIAAIPKQEYKDKFESLLYTGARYAEMRWLYKHKKNFDKKVIKIPTSLFKPKALHAERYIRLNLHGQRAVNYFLRSSKNLPADYVSWRDNLRRWCEMAGIDPAGVSAKTTRKTWESWLVSKYPKQLEYIFLSQGHSGLTALKFYLMLPFDEEDLERMEYYTGGWI